MVVLDDVMTMEEKQVNKTLYRLLLLVAKVIPMLLAFLHFINILFGYFNIDSTILTYLGGISFLPILFLYITSYALKFCAYHRMFIHYCVITNIINIYDEYVGIDIDNERYVMLLLILTIIMLFITLYLKLKQI